MAQRWEHSLPTKNIICPRFKSWSSCKTFSKDFHQDSAVFLSAQNQFQKFKFDLEIADTELLSLVYIWHFLKRKQLDYQPWLKWFCGRTIPACSCDCRDRWSIALWSVDGTIPRWVKGVVTLPCRLAPNNVRLGGWGWCIACEGTEEFNDMVIDWGEMPWVKPGGTAWQLLRSTEGL